MWIGSEALDLRLTLMDSAQCFCWQECERGFAAVLDNRAVCLWRAEDGIHAEGQLGADELRRYLDLERDYAALAAEYAQIPAARRAIELYPGLRVLNQPPWETLVSFILSANNNVARIRMLVLGLCTALGSAKEFAGRTLHAFPTPEALAACPEERLRALGVGYRAPFLIATARRVCEGFPLEALRNMDYEAAHARLIELSGVGDKVADCVLLFGCGQSCAFPVDVWVEKLLQSWFGIGGSNRKKLACAARQRLGANAGILQQFLFHAARMGTIEL